MRSSSRGHPLIYQGDPGDVTIVTVEHYEKWYGLFLVHAFGGCVEEIPFPSEDEDCAGKTPYVDHVPNPVVVDRMAHRLGYLVDPLSFEVMVGRWEIEVAGNYE
jgi:hypothetical protein